MRAMSFYAALPKKTPVLNYTISWSLFWPLIWLMVCVYGKRLQLIKFIRIQTCIICVESRPWRLSWRRSRPSLRCWWSGRGRARPAWSSSPQNSPPSAVYITDVLFSSVAEQDPGSGAFFTPGSDLGFQSHIFERLVTIFWVKSSKILLKLSQFFFFSTSKLK